MHKNFIITLILLLPVNVFAQNYFFVFLNTNYEKEILSKEKVDSLQAGHMANIERLASLKKIIVAGPFEGGGGIFIFNATSLEEVQQLLTTDPAISANRFKLEIFPYNPVKGGVCEIPHDAEMVTHSFIRIIPNTVSNDSSTNMLWDEVNPNEKLLAAGKLGDDGTAILLFDDSSFENDLQKLTLIPGTLKYYSKKLWVGKGSFCE